MTFSKSHRNLQVVTSILALVPLLTGLIGFSGYDNPLYKVANLPHNATTDSNLSFPNGFSVGTGIAIYRIVPESKNTHVHFALFV